MTRRARTCLRRLASVAAATLAFGLGPALAQLDVDSGGGPLTLAEDVAAAFAAWQNALPDEVLAEPSAEISYASELLGPDTASLTLRWEDGRTSVLLAPDAQRSGPVLVHELGVLLGLPELGAGVMDPVLRPEAPRGPTAEDITLLRDLRAYPPTDLTRDGVVDFYDLAAFGAAYGSVGINLRADLTGDGRVDDADLAVLREAYAFERPASVAPSAINLAPGAMETPEPVVEPAMPGAAEENGAPDEGPVDDEPSDDPGSDANGESEDAGSGASVGDSDTTPEDGTP